MIHVKRVFYDRITTHTRAQNDTHNDTHKKCFAVEDNTQYSSSCKNASSMNEDISIMYFMSSFL